MDNFIQNLATNALYQTKGHTLQSIASELQRSQTTDPMVAARDFEAMFVSQMLQNMFSSVPVDDVFGGGHAEETWRSLMIDEYGKTIAKTGGIGIANQVQQELLRLQGM